VIIGFAGEEGDRRVTVDGAKLSTANVLER
jgi:hypothetical protein